jgi:hypothetical protein
MCLTAEVFTSDILKYCQTCWFVRLVSVLYQPNMCLYRLGGLCNVNKIFFTVRTDTTKAAAKYSQGKTIGSSRVKTDFKSNEAQRLHKCRPDGSLLVSDSMHPCTVLITVTVHSRIRVTGIPYLNQCVIMLFGRHVARRAVTNSNRSQLDETIECWRH